MTSSPSKRPSHKKVLAIKKDITITVNAMPHNNFRLDAENMELRMELGQLRGRPDPHDVEKEIQRRVSK